MSKKHKRKKRMMKNAIAILIALGTFFKGLADFINSLK